MEEEKEKLRKEIKEIIKEEPKNTLKVFDIESINQYIEPFDIASSKLEKICDINEVKDFLLDSVEECVDPWKSLYICGKVFELLENDKEKNKFISIFTTKFSYAITQAMKFHEEVQISFKKLKKTNKKKAKRVGKEKWAVQVAQEKIIEALGWISLNYCCRIGEKLLVENPVARSISRLFRNLNFRLVFEISDLNLLAKFDSFSPSQKKKFDLLLQSAQLELHSFIGDSNENNNNINNNYDNEEGEEEEEDNEEEESEEEEEEDEKMGSSPDLHHVGVIDDELCDHIEDEGDDNTPYHSNDENDNNNNNNINSDNENENENKIIEEKREKEEEKMDVEKAEFIEKNLKKIEKEISEFNFDELKEGKELCEITELAKFHEGIFSLAKLIQILDKENIMVVYPKTNQIFIFEVYGMVDISHFHSILSYKLLAPLNNENSIIRANKFQSYPSEEVFNYLTGKIKEEDFHNQPRENLKSSWNFYQWFALNADPNNANRFVINRNIGNIINLDEPFYSIEKLPIISLNLNFDFDKSVKEVRVVVLEQIENSSAIVEWDCILEYPNLQSDAVMRNEVEKENVINALSFIAECSSCI